VKQQLWPEHCVHGTEGARFHPDLDRSMVSSTFPKGQDDRVDSYSGFYDNGRNAAPRFRKKYPFLGKSTGLAEYIRAEAEREGADEIVCDVIGLALRYCVSFTARDGRAEIYRGKQFGVRVVEDGVRAIVFADGEYEKELDELRALGIEIIHSNDVLTKIA
jgi:nicotinamidase/pyrazinamidase